jgi:hypothetical protein
MNKSPERYIALRDDIKTSKRISINHKRNKKQDHTTLLDQCATEFQYDQCKDEYWNPVELSLLYGTPVWNEADESQRILLNQLYWVAYYSQIISAEVATIFFNQTCAAGLFAIEGFREVCDMLDLESSQERAHINAFKTVSEQFEMAVFGERLFSWEMRNPFAQTMIFPNTNVLKNWWKALQLRTFGLLSAGNAFIASQYFTVRGMRTLNGKMIQQRLSGYYQRHPDKENAPIPSKISYYHFMDESYHFNSSCILGIDVIRSLPSPTSFERWVGNQGISGCQKDHRNFSAVVNGLFWYEPATFSVVYKLLRGPIFGMDDGLAKNLMYRCFAEENSGNIAAFQTLCTAIDSYERFLDPLEYVSKNNRNLSIMKKTTFANYIRTNKSALRSFGGWQ